MSIIRVAKQPNQFSIIDRTAADDERLSMKAKGIMFYLLTKPDDWTLNVKDLIRRSADGRDSIYSGIRELRELGYISMRKYQDGKGQFKIEYIVYENPQEELSTAEEVTDTENPNTENPNTENPNTENPYDNDIDLNDIDLNDIDLKERMNDAQILKFLRNNLQTCYVDDHTTALEHLREIYTRVIKEKSLEVNESRLSAAVQEWITRDFNYQAKTDARYQVSMPGRYFLDCLRTAAKADQAELSY
jgi:hypothetical protein